MSGYLTNFRRNAAEIQRHRGSGEPILKAISTPRCVMADDRRLHHNETYRTVSLSLFRVAFASISHAEDDQRRLVAPPSARCREAFVPAAILDKPEALTDEEMSVIRKHPRLGFDAWQPKRLPRRCWMWSCTITNSLTERLSNGLRGIRSATSCG